jgi:cyclic pyranopterin phosphate synthase
VITERKANMPADQTLTHFDSQGQAHMVDVAGKAPTHRVAIAKGRIAMTQGTAQLIARGQAAKGDVLAVARLAGIMASKKTSDLIPLCHPLALTHVRIDWMPLEGGSGHGYECAAQVETTGPTGVEMEALTAVSVALLTVYDMVKAVERQMTIQDIRLVHKRGGKSGAFNAGR